MNIGPVVFCELCGSYAETSDVAPFGIIPCSRCGGTEFLAWAATLGMVDMNGDPMVALVPIVVGTIP